MFQIYVYRDGGAILIDIWDTFEDSKRALSHKVDRWGDDDDSVGYRINPHTGETTTYQIVYRK